MRTVSVRLLCVIICLTASWLFSLDVISPRNARAAGPLAIQNAKIITISGDAVEKGTVLIRDGRIEAVGEDVDIPSEAMVIDGSGKVVMPGFIDAHNDSGMSQANERNELVPFLSVIDSIDPSADYFEECRRNGITTAAVVPGNSTLIGGKSAIVKTAGQYVNDMILRRDSALKISLRPTSGSRMSQMARLRKELDKARKAIEEEDESDEQPQQASDEKTGSVGDEEGEGETGDEEDADQDDDDSDSEDDNEEDSKERESDEEQDEGLEALKQVIRGELPVYIYCELAMDVVSALKLADDYNLKPIFVLGQDCYQAASLLADLGEPVILDPTLVYWEDDEQTRTDKKIALPKIYREAGVSFIFQIDDSGSRRNIGSSYFWYQAAMAVKQGLSEEKALAALTLEPSKLLGIEEFVGSIEVGKDADLILLTGEPLDISTWVEKTIIGGEVVYERSEDKKLQRLLSPEVE